MLKGQSVSKHQLLAFAVPLSLLSMTAAAEAQTVPYAPPANPITNPDGSVTVSIPPFDPQGGVRDRPRPEYDALGLRLGNFRVLPSVGAGGLYNSNVFNTPGNEQSDWALEVSPALNIVSDLPRHALSLLVSARSLFYNRLTSENTTDVTAFLRGRLDVRRDTNVVVDGGYQLLHEARGAPDLPGNAAEPTEYSAGTAGATFNHGFNRLQVSAGASYQRLDYRSTRLIPPGPGVLDNRDRDRNTVSVFAQAGYEFSPGYSAFLRGSYNDRSYDLKVDSGGYARDSHGAEVDGGFQLELTRLLVGQLYAGYLNQDYDDRRFNTVGGAAFGAQLQWYPTGLTTLHADARHSVEETTIAGASSYTTSHFGIGVDHELLRNVILSLDALYDDNRYNGTPRTDHFWGFSFGAMYLVNRHLQVSLGYVFSRRESNVASDTFSNNLLRFGIAGKI
jgi:hypothetical protein